MLLMSSTDFKTAVLLKIYSDQGIRPLLLLDLLDYCHNGVERRRYTATVLSEHFRFGGMTVRITNTYG